MQTSYETGSGGRVSDKLKIDNVMNNMGMMVYDVLGTLNSFRSEPSHKRIFTRTVQVQTGLEQAAFGEL